MTADPPDAMRLALPGQARRHRWESERALASHLFGASRGDPPSEADPTALSTEVRTL